MPFTPTPELARPDAEVLELLRALAARPDTEVHVVSGRLARRRSRTGSATSRSGSTPSTASVSRDPETRQWVPAAELGGSWREPVLAMLREITQRTPGSLVEVKTAALAWHYRMADQETGARRANELRLHLNQLLSNQPVEILAGNRVIEIRPYGVHKGRIVPALSPERLAATTIVAIGDDRTDEDLFNVLPPEAISIRVGPGATRARFRLDGVATVRQLLRSLLESGVAAVPGAALTMRIETLAVHAGHAVDPATGAVTPPIYLTTTFGRDADGSLPHGFIYARSDNPTRRELERCLAALEGGAVALAFASGMAATAAVFQSLAPGRPRRGTAGRLLRHRQAAPRGDGGLGAREHAGGHDRPGTRWPRRSRPAPASSGSRRRPTRRSP